jgi:hypothetical protein
MLSLSLPFANGDAEAAEASGFAPSAFIDAQQGAPADRRFR